MTQSSSLTHLIKQVCDIFWKLQRGILKLAWPVYQHKSVGGVITCCLMTNMAILKAQTQLEKQCDEPGTQNEIAFLTWVVRSGNRFCKLTSQVSSAAHYSKRKEIVNHFYLNRNLATINWNLTHLRFYLEISTVCSSACYAWMGEKNISGVRIFLFWHMKSIILTLSWLNE